ncbi:hypothetical protein [Maribacter aestuarii]|uniref:hypothetical protein n=1 Tax=Maribacter aestuarii TaxID=1130723 RepID=UPI00248CC7C6|nr:hypothetical protein [Maribacter aestuarii]
MGLYEYMMLSREQQWDELWDKGEFITHYKSIDCKFSLYALHAFFVEVELCVTTDRILGKGEFVSGHSLDKYAGSIDINSI